MKKEIIYCSTVCSEKYYRDVYVRNNCFPGQQEQKYHRLIVEGLSLCKDIEIRVLSMPPFVKNSGITSNVREEEYNGVNYKYLIRKYKPVISKIIFQTIQILRIARKDSVIVIDVLNIAQSIGTILASWFTRSKIVGIITDFPWTFGNNDKSLFALLGRWIIKKCNAYILMTEAMNDEINKDRQKKSFVMEGLVDHNIRQKNSIHVKTTKKRKIMFAGNISCANGIDVLVQGFLRIHVPDVELHIYGSGDYKEEIEKIARDERTNVFYHGVKENGEIVKELENATLLVNPRPTNNYFVKYSFPSKNMEYMASGTPLLTTVLPGMPKDYYDHVFLLEDETIEGMSVKLNEILSLSSNELMAKGKSAQAFVLSNKNNIIWAEKIKDFVTKL